MTAGKRSGEASERLKAEGDVVEGDGKEEEGKQERRIKVSCAAQVLQVTAGVRGPVTVKRQMESFIIEPPPPLLEGFSG